eukprot:1718_1
MATVEEELLHQKIEILTHLQTEQTNKYRTELLRKQVEYDRKCDKYIATINHLEEQNKMQRSSHSKEMEQLQHAHTIKVTSINESSHVLSSSLKKQYDAQLRKAHKDIQELKDEFAQHMSMQKSIEQEAIYLAARKANLEEERQELLSFLDQKDDEIAMLHQTLGIKKWEMEAQNVTGKQDVLVHNEDDLEVEEQYYQYNDGDESENSETEGTDDLDHQDEIDIIAEILDDENIFVSDESQSDEGSSKNRGKEPAITEESRDNKAFDKLIKEYLHLTASAVKIKYPSVRNIQSDQLIKRVKDLPFYKYHDQMTRIMEQQIKKLRDTESTKQPMENRKEFLAIFNIFGRDVLDTDEVDDDNDGNNSSDEDSGITRRTD